MPSTGEPKLGVVAPVNEARLWQRHLEMAKIGATPAGGVHRLPFTPEDTISRRLFLDWAGARGFTATMDDFGNIFIRRSGTDNAAPPVVSGSHSDTQPKGGRFDGIYGVLAALEALEAIEDAGIKTKRPIEAVIWTAEEADAQFGVGCLGSQAYADPSKLPALLQKQDKDGVTVEQALAAMMDDHPKLERRPLKSPIGYYVEAHIEQGPELEAQGKTIGVVTGIQGIRGFKVEITGEAAHAGNTPERLRKDALVAAVRIIGELRKVFHDPKDIVRFTIGRMEISPNAMGVIPGYAAFTIDFRHPDEGMLGSLGNQVAAVAQAHAPPCNVKVSELRKVFHDPKDVVRFTIGRMDVSPNAMGVVPGYVAFTIDFRHPDEATLRHLGDQVEAVAQAYAPPCHVNVSQLRRDSPVRFEGVVPDTVLDVTRQLGYPYMHIPSGAGHDARYIAEISPAGMIFIPCLRGLSHNEAEHASPRDVGAGAQVLTNTLIALANR